METSTPAAVGTRSRSRWRWPRRLLLGLLGLILLAALVGAGFEALSRRSDAQRFKPPGQLVDLGGRRLHVHCSGSGSPTVVLDAGLGIGEVLWRLVQPEVAAFASVCSYDRAGYGYSDPGPLPRTVERRGDDLRAALRAAGRPPPYVLVGHSAAGLLARSYQLRFPQEVTGMVLVDASHESQFARAPKSMAAGMRDAAGQIDLVVALLPLGLPRLMIAADAPSQAPSAALADESVAEAVRPAYFEALRSEGEALLRGGEVPPGAGLGALPLVVLTAGRWEPMDGIPPADDAAFRDLWARELQPELARLSSRGRQVVVADSAHLIPWQRPRAVVDAVREVVEASRLP
jgi:pimeloyl-ACP methyl ester carboxylesterase